MFSNLIFVFTRRLTCCGKGVPRRYSLRKKKKKTPPSESEYQTVEQNQPPPPTSSSVAPPSTLVEMERSAVVETRQDLINTRLAYEEDPRQSKAPPPALTSAPPSATREMYYAELSHEPRRSKMDRLDSTYATPPDNSPPLSPVYMQPIYAKVRPKSATSRTADDDTNPPSSTPDADDEMNDVSPPPPNRKSYIPLVYRKESPEVQQKQQALNDELKEAVRINRVTDF